MLHTTHQTIYVISVSKSVASHLASSTTALQICTVYYVVHGQLGFFA